MLGGAGGHFLGGNQNRVGAAGNIDRGLAHALQHLGEVVEHVIDGIHHVAQRVVGHLAAQRQVAAGDLAGDGQEFGHALLQRVLRFLVEDGARDFVGGAVKIFRDVTEIVGGIELHARAIFARAQLLAEIGELFHWPDDLDVEHIERESRA